MVKVEIIVESTMEKIVEKVFNTINREEAMKLCEHWIIQEQMNLPPWNGGYGQLIIRGRCTETHIENAA